ncbi:MAG TPA: LysE family translocator [Gammaproteobacteria bacterium]|nr:LysE family translocator [Gammaproteobacteria bacterium]HIK69818.1 LysE family translocator [Pseudomonadales bacterium]
MPTLLAFITFATIAAYTPGPNNLMLAASGANFGFQKSIPHIAGVTIGFCLLVTASVLGLSRLFNALPWIYTTSKAVGCCFLIFLAWKILVAEKLVSEGNASPISLIQAAFFQLVNPKAVLVIISSVSAFTRGSDKLFSDLLIFVGVFFIITLSSACIWTVFGSTLSTLLNQQRNLRIFNFSMALLLLASLIPVII